MKFLSLFLVIICETIERCINSIKNQSFKDWEALLIDDDSTDNTSQIINNSYHIMIIDLNTTIKKMKVLAALEIMV